MNIDSLSQLRTLLWEPQAALNRTITPQTHADAGPEQFEASLCALSYEAVRPAFIRNRFLAANANEEYYYQRIAQLTDDVVIYKRIKGLIANPMRNHICVVFRGSHTTNDFWTDFNVIAEPVTGPTVFQARIDQIVTDLTGLLPGLSLAGNTISFMGHSLGFAKSEAVLYKLLETNVLNPNTTFILQYGFCPFVWNSSSHQVITQAVSQNVSGNPAFAKYAPIANNTSLYCIEGDYVSLLQKIDWIGYGATYTRPNVGGLISSTADWYSNGVLTESDNHKAGNWISGADKFPEVIEETPAVNHTDSNGVSHPTDGTAWFVTNSKQVSFAGHLQRLNLESDSVGSVISTNLYHDGTLDDLQFRWSLTKDPILANSLIYTSMGQHFIAFKYTLSNSDTNYSQTVMFFKDNTYVPSGIVRDYYLIRDYQSHLLLQIKQNPTETSIDHITGWSMANPLPDLPTYSNYTQNDAKDRTLWFLSHFVNDKSKISQFEAADDGLRRLYPQSISTYIPPFTYMLFSNHQTTDTHGRTHIMGGTPTTTHFAIESVEYPGYFLQYTSDPSPLGTSNGVTTVAYSYTAGGQSYTDLHYNTQFMFTQPTDTTNWDTKYKFNRWGTNDYSGIRHINSSYANGLNEDWHGAQYHAFYNVDGTNNEWVIDTEMNASWANSTHPGIGLAMAHTVSNTIYLAYPYRYEYDYVDQTTGSWKASSSTINCLRFRLVQV